MKNKVIKNVILCSTIFIILFIFLAFILPGLRGSNKNTKTVEKKKKTEKTQQAPAQTPAPIVGKIKTLYRFADYPNGIVPVDVKSDAEFYPKGGKIKYKNTRGEINSDEPGTNHVKESKPAGEFTFWADDSNAWGVEIWQ